MMHSFTSYGLVSAKIPGRKTIALDLPLHTTFEGVQDPIMGRLPSMAGVNRLTAGNRHPANDRCVAAERLSIPVSFSLSACYY